MTQRAEAECAEDSLGWTEGKEVFLKGDFKPNNFFSCSLEGLEGVGGNMERTGTRG